MPDRKAPKGKAKPKTPRGGTSRSASKRPAKQRGARAGAPASERAARGPSRAGARGSGRGRGTPADQTARRSGKAARGKAAKPAPARRKAPADAPGAGQRPRSIAGGPSSVADRPAARREAPGLETREPGRGGPAAPGRAPRGGGARRITARERADDEHYRPKLLQARASILKNLEELREELRGLQEPSHELEEWAQEEKDRDILIRLELREKEELQRVQAALQRLEQGTYGQCARCGRRISKARLEEVPTAVFCRNCQPG